MHELCTTILHLVAMQLVCSQQTEYNCYSKLP